MSATTDNKPEVKVLVRSKYREVLARTGWTDETETKGIYRQFHEHEAYMTPEEAVHLVESDENRAYIEGGHPAMYYYPAGQAFPVPANAGGEMLSAPLGEDGLATTDERQATAARKANERIMRKAQEKQEREEREARARLGS